LSMASSDQGPPGAGRMNQATSCSSCTAETCKSNRRRRATTSEVAKPPALYCKSADLQRSFTNTSGGGAAGISGRLTGVGAISWRSILVPQKVFALLPELAVISHDLRGNLADVVLLKRIRLAGRSGDGATAEVEPRVDIAKL